MLYFLEQYVFPVALIATVWAGSYWLAFNHITKKYGYSKGEANSAIVQITLFWAVIIVGKKLFG